MSYPLISCVMPTCNRKHFVKDAIDCFNAQSYPNKELIILDDSSDPDEISGENIKYIYIGPKRKSIPVKRNLLCEKALGTIIAHFDDDDLSSPDRLIKQFEILTCLEKYSITGFNRAIFHDVDKHLFHFYNGTRYFALGSSLMFYKIAWERVKFNEMYLTGSDNEFVSQLQRQIKSVDGSELLVVRKHKQATNTMTYARQHGFVEAPNSAIPNWYMRYLQSAFTF